MEIYLFDFFEKNLRSNFFTGFLTIGTFLFAVKTFIIVKIKEDVFDKDFYLERIKKQQKLNSQKTIQHYKPLKRLTSVLFYAALSSLVCATLQLTLGLVEKNWAAFICISSAAIALTLLFFAMILVKLNLDIWLEEIEINSTAVTTVPHKA